MWAGRGLDAVLSAVIESARSVHNSMLGTHVEPSAASPGMRKLEGGRRAHGVSSIRVTDPTPASTMFLATCGRKLCEQRNAKGKHGDPTPSALIYAGPAASCCPPPQLGRCTPL
jgi:hypothetical protein